LPDSDRREPVGQPSGYLDKRRHWG